MKNERERQALQNGHEQLRRERSARSSIAAEELRDTTSHPDYEHWTCGTDHIRAQRTLRIVESAAPYGLTVELVQALGDLVYDAGIANCREALAEPMGAVPF